jgi:hypothetical protein
LKNFPGVIPRTPVKGEGRKGRTEGKEGIRDTDGEEGSGMRQGRRGRDKGYTEERDGKGGKGKEGGKR